jgi:hypothetical protein
MQASPRVLASTSAGRVRSSLTTGWHCGGYANPMRFVVPSILVQVFLADAPSVMTTTSQFVLRRAR